MKYSNTFLFALIVLALQISLCHAQGKEGALLAPQYPGSVIDPNRPLSGAPSQAVLEARSREFYTKDPIEKVMAFYKTLGKFHESPEGNHIQVCDVVPFNDVVAIVEKKGGTIGEGGDNFWGGTMAGVTLYGKPTNNRSHYSVTQVFDKLQRAYLARFETGENVDLTTIQKHLDDPELNKIEDRYEHLKWSYFMQTKEKRKDSISGNLTVDEVIFDKYFTDPEQARTKEIAELQKKVTELTRQAKYDEAAKLGDRMVKLSGIVQTDGKEEMKTVLQCLEEMDEAAYATTIVIDMHPSRWDLALPKN